MPDGFGKGNRIKEMDMGSGKPCRMLSYENLLLDAGKLALRQAALALADEHLSVGQAGKDCKACKEVILTLLDDNRRLNRKGVGVNCGYENGVGN